MPFVLDASASLAWHFPVERNAKADAILAAVQSDEAVVPAVWWFEIRNGLLIGERRGRTSQQDTTMFLNFLAELPISVALLPDEVPVLQLARRHRLSFYDAAYLELAKREQFTLATIDGDLIAAAKAEGVSLAP